MTSRRKTRSHTTRVVPPRDEAPVSAPPAADGGSPALAAAAVAPRRPGRAPRELNLRWLFGSLALLTVLVPSVYFYHRHQLERVTNALLARATELERSGDDQRAVHYLYRGLQLTGNQPEVQRDLLVRLARGYDRSPVLSADRATVIQWHYRAVGAAPDDQALQLRLAELFLDTEQFVLAEEQAHLLLERDADSRAAQRVRALARYGQLRRGRPVVGQQVLTELQAAQRFKPDDVEVAEALAYVYREAISAGGEFDPEARADAVMDALVRHAPQDHRAYLARHRYQLAYGRVPDGRDIRRAVELARVEPDVILAAAEEAQRHGELGAAIEQFRELVRVRPQDFRGYLGWGESLHRNGQLDEALSAWREGLAQVSRGRLPLRVRLTEGLIEADEFAAAEAQLRELDNAIRYLTTGDGEHQRDWIVSSRDLLRAKLHMQRGEYRQSVPLLQRVATTAKADRSQVVEAMPAYQAWLLMGQALMQLQQWEEAATSFQRALQLVPGSITARLWAAQAWSAVGRDDQALVLCEQAARRENAPDNAWLMLAQLHLRTQMRLTPEQRDWQRLEEVLQRASAALPDSWEIPLVRANLVVLRDAATGVSQALQILAEQEQIHQGSIGLWSNLVFLYERMGLPSEAERALAQLKSLQPGSAQPLAWEVALHAARGNFEAAASALDRAPERISDADREWLDRARLMLAYQKGELAEIREELLRINAERPQGTQVLAQLADLALAVGDWTECDRWIAQLHAAEGSDGIWWRFFEARRLLASDASLRPETLARATARYDEIRRLRPWWPGAAMLRGLLADVQGMPGEASEAYSLAVRSGFHQPHVYERLIRSLYEQGRFEEANQWLVQFQQAAPLDVRLLDLAWTTAVQRNQAELAVRLARQNLERNPDQPAAHVWLAQMLLISGEREEASRAIESARQMQPEDLASWTGLLAYDLHRGQADEARRDLETLAQHPDLPAAKFDVLAAYAYQQLGDRAGAEKHYRHALEATPDDVDLRVRFATFMHPFDPAEAESELRDALARAPGHAAARRTLATWLHGRDNPASQQEARELLKTSEGSWHQQAADRRLEALLLARRGKPEDLQAAQMLLEQLIAEAREVAANDRLLLSRVYERRGNLLAAEEQLKLLADSSIETAQHIAFYVDFLLRRQRLEDARLYLERLERLAPMSLTAVSLRSRWLLASGRVDEIDGYLESFAQRQLAQLRDAIQRQQFMRQVAGLFAAVERPAAAERWYRRLVAEYPDQREVLANFLLERNQVPDSLEFALREVQQETTPATAALLARVMIQGELDHDQAKRAETLFADVLQSHPNDPHFLFSLASLRLKQNDVEAAEELLRKLTEVHPEHVTAWNNLAAILADDPQRLDEALASIDRAIAAAGQPLVNLLDTKAVILLQLGRNREAADLLQQVLARADAKDSRYHFHYAVVQLRLGDAAQARQSWRRAQELGLARSYLTRYERQLVSDLSSALEEIAAGL